MSGSDPYMFKHQAPNLGTGRSLVRLAAVHCVVPSATVAVREARATSLWLPHLDATSAGVSVDKQAAHHDETTPQPEMARATKYSIAASPAKTPIK